MHFSDRPASTGLEIAKVMTADAGAHICPDTSKQIKRGYVDDNAGGRTKDFVDRLIGKKPPTLQASFNMMGQLRKLWHMEDFG